jgi:hypothetical protein
MLRASSHAGQILQLRHSKMRSTENKGNKKNEGAFIIENTLHFRNI